MKKLNKKEFSIEKIVEVLIKRTLDHSLKWKWDEEESVLTAQEKGLTIKISNEGGPDHCSLTIRKKNKEIYRSVSVDQTYGLFPKMRRLTLLAKNTAFEKEILRTLKK